jgi:hypothetical protein
MKFEIFTAVKMWIVVFWVVTLYSIVGDYQHFRGTYNLHFQGRSEGNYFPEDRSDMFLQNAGNHLQDYMAS